MATLTKAQVYKNTVEQIEALLENSKTSKTFREELLLIIENNIAPKKSGGSVAFPPKLNEDGEIIEAYCRFHQRYEVVENMVMSNGKSKGYCKASISLWNKTNSNIKKLDAQAVNYMTDGDFENAQKIAQESKELKTKLNAPDFYDYERDWAEFNTPKSKEA